MSTTNDEQERRSRLLADMMHDDAKDGLYDEQPKREPLLSDDTIRELAFLHCPDNPIEYADGMKHVLDIVHFKIASGELMVVKTATATKSEMKQESWGYVMTCDDCGAWAYHMDFCPGCGSKIVE
ncbi:MAG TPA: hypothetical protein PKJ19_13290 [Flavobacteriales bacterium]|nr:hypothetical protein [Flavobacteriales bacterium]